MPARPKVLFITDRPEMAGGYLIKLLRKGYDVRPVALHARVSDARWPLIDDVVPELKASREPYDAIIIQDASPASNNIMLDVAKRVFLKTDEHTQDAPAPSPPADAPPEERIRHLEWQTGKGLAAFARDHALEIMSEHTPSLKGEELVHMLRSEGSPYKETLIAVDSVALPRKPDFEKAGASIVLTGAEARSWAGGEDDIVDAMDKALKAPTASAKSAEEILQAGSKDAGSHARDPRGGKSGPSFGGNG